AIRVQHIRGHRVPQASQHFAPFLLESRNPLHLRLPRTYRPCRRRVELKLSGIAADMVQGTSMVRLTRRNHLPVVVNSDLIEHIEETPDTVIILTTGQVLRVRETVDEVVDRIVEFRRRIQSPDPPTSGLRAESPSRD